MKLWLYGAAAVSVVAGVAIALTLPAACPVDDNPFIGMTPEQLGLCEPRTALQIAVVAAGLVVAAVLMAVATRTSARPAAAG